MSLVRCPHCKSPAKVRSSREVSDLSREQHCMCQNVECGHTFTVVSTVIRTLSPSAIPDPSISLPMSTHVDRALIGHQVATAQADHYQPVNEHTRARTLDLFTPEPRPG